MELLDNSYNEKAFVAVGPSIGENTFFGDFASMEMIYNMRNFHKENRNVLFCILTILLQPPECSMTAFYDFFSLVSMNNLPNFLLF